MEFSLSLDYAKFLADQYIVPFGINLVLAAIIFILGRLVARLLVTLMDRLLARAKVEESLRKFLTDLAYILLLVVVVIASLERLGIKTTAAIAVIGAAGLAVGLALQGSLGNFASGVMIILFKPYRVGDLVKLDGHTGHVDAVKIFNTVIITLDNRKIIIPNGTITGSTIENISARGKVRLELFFGISYSDDIDKAKEVLLDILKRDKRILEEPEPLVAVCELGDSSVNFAVFPYVDPADYWPVRFHITEQVKKQFDANGISIPFPQRDVHLFREDAA